MVSFLSYLTIYFSSASKGAVLNIVTKLTNNQLLLSKFIMAPKAVQLKPGFQQLHCWKVPEPCSSKALRELRSLETYAQQDNGSLVSLLFCLLASSVSLSYIFLSSSAVTGQKDQPITG